MEMKRDEIVKILTNIPKVEKDVKRLYKDRQVHVDAANVILIGATLIASVMFARWLQLQVAFRIFSILHKCKP
jgi:hypothetical protein